MSIQKMKIFYIFDKSDQNGNKRKRLQNRK